jgi:hypothetical protein
LKADSAKIKVVVYSNPAAFMSKIGTFPKKA